MTNACRILNGAYGKNSLYLILVMLFNKNLEIGYQYGSKVVKLHGWFDFSVSLRTGGDHAGLRAHIEIGRLFIEFTFADTRHWNYSAGRYYLPGEEEARQAEWDKKETK